MYTRLITAILCAAATLSCAEGPTAPSDASVEQATPAKGVCAGTLLFSCKAAQERIDLCLSSSGTELTLVSTSRTNAQRRALPVGSASYASDIYSGGGESQIILDLGDRKLVLFGRSVAEFDETGKSGADFSDGYFEFKDGRALRDRQCDSIFQPVYGKVASPVMKSASIVPH